MKYFTAVSQPILFLTRLRLGDAVLAHEDGLDGTLCIFKFAAKHSSTEAAQTKPHSTG